MICGINLHPTLSPPLIENYEAKLKRIFFFVKQQLFGIFLKRAWREVTDYVALLP